MRFFGKLNGLKAAQAAAKMPPLMHPGNVPATMKQFPADFHGYQFVGATTDMISIRGANEVVTRRPALVALLKYESISADGASSLIEMTASLRDLSNARHPDASKIGDSLRTYYETKVYGGEREAAPNEQFALPKAAPRQTQPAAEPPSNAGMSLFAKLNSFDPGLEHRAHSSTAA